MIINISTTDLVKGCERLEKDGNIYKEGAAKNIFKSLTFYLPKFFKIRYFIYAENSRVVILSPLPRMDLNKRNIKEAETPTLGELDIHELNIRIKKKLKLNIFYRAISENGEDIIKVLTADGTILFINPSVEKMVGFSAEELLGKNILSFIHPSSDKRYKSLLDFNKKWDYRKVKLTIPHKEGHLLYFESYCYFKIKVSQRELFVLICKNVTQRVLKTKQLIKAKIREERAASLFKELNELSGNIISLWNVRKEIPIYYSNKHPLGYHFKDDCQTLMSYEIIHPDDRVKVKSYRSRISTVRYFNPPIVEYRIKDINGKWQWLLNKSIVTERDESGYAVLLLSHTSIITEFKETQQQLLESSTRIATLLNNTKESIWSMDRNYCVTSFNNQFVNQYLIFCGAYPKFGSPMFAHSSKNDTEVWQPLYDRAFSGETFTQTVVSILEDRKSYFECTFAPIKGIDGKIDEICCFVRDITATKQYEAELEQLNFELDSFVYRASHDMLAPLKSILGLVDILRMDLSSGEKERYLGLVDKSVLKLQSFIQHLTYFSRNSKAAVSIEPINFSEIINECIENLGFAENAERLNVIYDIDTGIHFYSDKSRIQIIFQNFISNAIKYQRLNVDKSYLRVAISQYEKGVLIQLEDNGRGIKKEYLENIFDMFFRASDESYGSGLGLYITKQAIEKLRGRILKVHSVFGEGTSFSIYLPSQPTV